MSEIVERLQGRDFMGFAELFRVEEGRMGVTVTFIALLELVREGLAEMVQADTFAPLHVRAAVPQPDMPAANDDTAGAVS